MSDVVSFRGNQEQASVVRTMLRPLAPFLNDKTLFEIVVNRPGKVLTEGMGGWQSHDVKELSFAHLYNLARTVASFSNQNINETQPVLSATLPYGERIQIVIPPATEDGTVSMTIRKPSTVSFTLDDMQAGGFFDDVKIAPDELAPNEIELQGLLKGGNTIGSITTVHADSARMAFEQLTLLVKESEGGQDLERDDIRKLLFLSVDIVVQCKRINGQFRAPEIYFDPMKKRELVR